MNDLPSPASPAGSDLPAGTRVGTYRIEGLLGRGAMGVVYAARDDRNGLKVALKILSDTFVTSTEARQRLYAEGWLAASLDHPNLRAVHEIGEADGRAYVAMEHVSGVTLDVYARQHTFDPARALRIAIQLARAVRGAHARGVVHRDLKSANVIVSSRDEVKVLDFGLAFRPDTSAIPAVPGIRVGAADYASPEQILGRDIDSRTDLFSLGVVLHEMLTGRLPFSGENRTELFRAIVNNPAMPVDELNDAVPVAMSNVVGRLLTKDRDARYQSATEVLDDLEAIAEPRPSPRVPADRMADNPWFHRIVGTAAGLALAVGGLFPATVVLSYEAEAAIRSTAARQSGVWRGVTVSHAMHAVVTAAERPDSVWIGNDGRIVYSTSGHAGRTAIWTLPAGGSASELVTEFGRQPSVSPDGRFVVFVGAEGHGVFRSDVSGQGVIRLASGPAESPRITPDGASVLFSDRRVGGVWSVPLLGGARRHVVAGDITSAPLVSPDGRLLAFERNGQTVICELPACSGERRLTIGQIKAWTPDGSGLAYVGQPRSANIWVAPIDGSASRQATWFTGRAVSSVAWSPDGSQLAVTRVMTLADFELLAFR